MLKKLLLTLLISFTYTSYSQDKSDKIIYLDSLNTETSYPHHESSILIKEFNKEKSSYNVAGYYKSGKLKFQGTYSDKYMRIKDGIFTYYYENGNPESRVMYNKDVEYGDFTAWYDNKNKKTEGEYIFSKKENLSSSELKIYNFWNEKNEQKVFNGNGQYTETDKDQTEYGPLKNGVKDGLWEGKSTNPTRKNAITYSETYEDGILLYGTSFNEEGQSFDYTQFQKMAEPKKGMNNFYKEISRKIEHPKTEELIKPIKVLIAFIINKDGSISDLKTIKSNNSKVENSLKKALANSPNWNPALQRGQPVRSKFSLPITINPN